MSTDLKHLLLIGDYAIVMACLLFIVGMSAYAWNVSTEMIGFVSTAMGWFAKCIADAHGFEFASTRGSQAKDLVLKDLVEKNGKSG